MIGYIVGAPWWLGPGLYALAIALIVCSCPGEAGSPRRFIFGGTVVPLSIWGATFCFGHGNRHNAEFYIVPVLVSGAAVVIALLGLIGYALSPPKKS